MFAGRISRKKMNRIGLLKRERVEFPG